MLYTADKGSAHRRLNVMYFAEVDTRLAAVGRLELGTLSLDNGQLQYILRLLRGGTYPQRYCAIQYHGATIVGDVHEITGLIPAERYDILLTHFNKRPRPDKGISNKFSSRSSYIVE